MLGVLEADLQFVLPVSVGGAHVPVRPALERSLNQRTVGGTVAKGNHICRYGSDDVSRP